MWTFEHSEEASASREAVWALWSEVASWPRWDAGIEWVALDGPFATGTTGRLKPGGARVVRFTITDADPRRGFADVTRLPLARMRFEHELADAADGRIRITHRVTISGLAAPLFARVIGRGLARELPATVRALAEQAQRS